MGAERDTLLCDAINSRIIGTAQKYGKDTYTISNISNNSNVPQKCLDTPETPLVSVTISCFPGV